MYGKLISSMVLITMIISGCTSTKIVPDITKTSRPVVLPSASPILPTSTQAPFISPTANLPPTLTASETPVFPLTSTGPWLVLSSQDGLWVANADGSGLVQFANTEQTGRGTEVAFAPQGGLLAYVLPSYEPSATNYYRPQLMLVNLPSLSMHPLTYLLPDKPLEGFTSSHTDLNGEIFDAVFNDRSLAWSPDGTYLAFASAYPGPSSDLYVYSILDHTLNRLTSGPTQTIDLNWSPDGKHIVSIGAPSMNFGSGGSSGPTLGSVWVVRPDGSDLHIGYTYPDNWDTQLISLGWLNNNSYIEYYSRLGCGIQGLTFIDVISSQHYHIIPGAFASTALDPATGTLLTMVTPPFDPAITCGSSPLPGLYIISAFENKPTVKISYEEIVGSGDTLQVLGWSSLAHVFFINSGNGVFTVNLKGQITPIDVPNIYSNDFSMASDPNELFKVSPDGRNWAMFSPDGLWIASTYQPSINISSNTIDDILWALDGTGLLFVSNNTLYRAFLPDFHATAIAGPFPPGNYPVNLNWVMP